MKHPCLPQLSLKGKKMGQFLLDADSPETWRPPLSCVAKMPRAVLVLCTHSPRDLQALQQVCRAWHGGRHRAFHPAQPPPPGHAPRCQSPHSGALWAAFQRQVEGGAAEGGQCARPGSTRGPPGCTRGPPVVGRPGNVPELPWRRLLLEAGLSSHLQPCFLHSDSPGAEHPCLASLVLRSC